MSPTWLVQDLLEAARGILSGAMEGHGNPFWSRRTQEDLAVRLARPESLPEELPLIPEDVQEELSIDAGHEHAEDLVEFENELRASSGKRWRSSKSW